jgi:hypothetical protein
MVRPQKFQARQDLLQCIMESADHIKGNEEIIRSAADSLGDAQNCGYRTVEIILNSNQCNIIEN